MSAFTDFQTAIYKMLEAIPGEDVNRPGLKDTPERVAKFYLHEMIHGYTQNVNNLIKNSIYESSANDLISVNDIKFYSVCEHHFIPFFGNVDITYIPRDGKILDVSKFGRVIDVYSKRLQSQETLTQQIATALYQSSLRPAGITVKVKAEHLCMAMRGARKQDTKVTTRASFGSLIQ